MTPPLTPPRICPDTAPSTPGYVSGQTSPARTGSPDTWSTLGTPYSHSLVFRRSSIGSTTTAGTSSVCGSDNSPSLRQTSQWSVGDDNAQAKPFVGKPLDAADFDSNTEENEEAGIQQEPVFFANLQLGKRIGEGQWSTVYEASFDGAARTSLEYTKSSPSRNSRHSHCVPQPRSHSTHQPISTMNTVVAAKVGSGRSSAKVLANESRFLKLLMGRPWAKDFVVGFHGYDVDRNMLLMENIPLTLENLVESMEMESVKERRGRVMDELLPIAYGLVNGLHFLHGESIIHGDIKPSNILLRGRRKPRDIRIPDKGLGDMHNPEHGNFSILLPNSASFSGHEIDFQPVYCDFSASRLDHPMSYPSQSGGTYDYMAPELFSRTHPNDLPTPASDVYALGVTLLYAITGGSPYAAASNVFMRRAMAMSGTPLDFARGDVMGETRMRVAEGCLGLERAVSKDIQRRWTASEWTRWLECESRCTKSEEG